MSLRLDGTQSRGFERFYLADDKSIEMTDIAGQARKLGKGWMVLEEREYLALLALVEVVKIGRAAISTDLVLTVESSTIPHPDGFPDFETMDEDAQEVCDELTAQLTLIDRALAHVEGHT